MLGSSHYGGRGGGGRGQFGDRAAAPAPRMRVRSYLNPKDTLRKALPTAPNTHIREGGVSRPALSNTRSRQKRKKVKLIYLT